MPEEKALSDESDQPHPLRDQVRRAAPLALWVAAGAGSVILVAKLLNSRSSPSVPTQLPRLNPPPTPVGPVTITRLVQSHTGTSGRLRGASHVVSGYDRRDGVHVNSYLRPRARRGPESLSASQLAEVVGRC